MIALLIVAAILGDTVNYIIGKFFGSRVMKLSFRGKPIVKEKYIQQTHDFYEKHGSKTIILARFVPIVRTFAPFVAGIGSMEYKKFISFNVIGGIVWITSLSLLGYFIGTNPIVKENFEFVILGIIAVSVLPMIYEILKNYFKSKSSVN